MRKKEASILIVDDDDDILFSARISLKKYFTEIITTNNPKKIRNYIISQTFDVVLLDMNYRIGFEDGKEGLYWLQQIKEISPETTVILMTAFGSVNLAVEAIKQGATDFILKLGCDEKSDQFGPKSSANGCQCVDFRRKWNRKICVCQRNSSAIRS